MSHTPDLREALTRMSKPCYSDNHDQCCRVRFDGNNIRGEATWASCECECHRAAPAALPAPSSAGSETKWSASANKPAERAPDGKADS